MFEKNVWEQIRKNAARSNFTVAVETKVVKEVANIIRIF